jgi:metal transporter CNNM
LPETAAKQSIDVSQLPNGPCRIFVTMTASMITRINRDDKNPDADAEGAVFYSVPSASPVYSDFATSESFNEDAVSTDGKASPTNSGKWCDFPRTRTRLRLGLFSLCLAVILIWASGPAFLVPSQTSSLVNHPVDLNDSILDAKELLVSLGVPEHNLCRTHSKDDKYLWVLPPCDKMASNLPQPQRSVSAAISRNLDDCPETPATEEEEPSFEDDPWFYVIHAVCALACVTTAALAAGLTMGLLSLDPLMLLIKMRAANTQKEKDQAASLLPIVKQHHLLLVTLLLLNSIANEALPLFLEVLVSPVVAVILSVTFVLFFGEIIPSAVFTGPQKIDLASKMVPLVRIVMLLLWPIAYPIARVLDVVLHDEEGEEEGAFNRGELSALVRIQYEERMANKQQRKIERAQFRRTNSSRSSPSDRQAFFNGSQHPPGTLSPAEMDAAIKAVRNEVRWAKTHSRISDSCRSVGELERSQSIHLDEVMIVEGALQMKTKTALDIFCPLNRMFALPYDLVLNEDNVVDIYSSGYTRIPVYERDPVKPKSPLAIRGLLNTKHLIVINMSEERPISTLPLLIPPCVSPKTNLIDLVNLFQTGKRGHFALVCARPSKGEEALKEGKPLPKSAGLMGIITFEDVLEELLQEQIYDENDKMEKEAGKIARWVTRKWRGLKRHRELEAAGKTASMGSVVLDAMAAHENESAGERTFLLQKERQEGSNNSSEGGIVGFFQNLTRQSSTNG